MFELRYCIDKDNYVSLYVGTLEDIVYYVFEEELEDDIKSDKYQLWVFVEKLDNKTELINRVNKLVQEEL